MGLQIEANRRICKSQNFCTLESLFLHFYVWWIPPSQKNLLDPPLIDPVLHKKREIISYKRANSKEDISLAPNWPILSHLRHFEPISTFWWPIFFTILLQQELFSHLGLLQFKSFFWETIWLQWIQPKENRLYREGMSSSSWNIWTFVQGNCKRVIRLIILELRNF